MDTKTLNGIEGMIRSLSGDAFEKIVPAVQWMVFIETLWPALGMVAFISVFFWARIMFTRSNKQNPDSLIPRHNIIEVITIAICITSILMGLFCFLTFCMSIPNFILSQTNPELITTIRILEKF